MKLISIKMGLVMSSCLVMLLTSTNLAVAGSLSDMKWSHVCSGKMGDEWYGSDEAKEIADVVVYVQKDNGGWMKNDQLHRLSKEEKEKLRAKRDGMSCLDNDATTQEMRYLAKVYQKTGEEKYKDAFNRGLNMILAAERNGGWSQYWPLRGKKGYWDYITFNDNLMTNVLSILMDIRDEQDDFKGLASAEARRRCDEAFQRGIDMVIRCQIDDNGTPAAWCAQHDPETLLPAEGRPHELPSISGQESASLLKFLMKIENPSEELQNTIHTAVAWLDAHKMQDKALEEFVNEDGVADRRIVDKPGSVLWARFIQMGGKSGEAMYQSYFQKLKERGGKHKYEYNGKTYTYTDYETAIASYRPEMAYQPIYGIYEDEYPHLFYRFLYSFEDEKPMTDEKGVEVTTSLGRDQRFKYLYVGTWPQHVIEVDYPKWKKRMEKKHK